MSTSSNLSSETVTKDARWVAEDIARELRANPERWTRGSVAHNSSGRATNFNSTDAICWCLMGHILKRGGWGFLEEVQEAFFSAAGSDVDVNGFADINDCRTVEQIIELCDKVAANE